MINTVEFSKLSIQEMIKFIIKTYHEPLKKLLPEIKIQLEKIKHFPEKFHLENFGMIKELFEQFESELSTHILREENKFYAEIIKLEKKEKVDKKIIEEFLDLQKTEHSEIDSYLYSLKKLIFELSTNNVGNIKKGNSEEGTFEELKKIFHTLYLELSECIYIENTILNLEIEELFG